MGFNKIKDWFLVTQGLEILKVSVFYKYFLLAPYGVIFNTEDYKDQILSTEISLPCNNIEDISPLAQLPHLTWVNLHKNNIKDLKPLKNLVNLESVNLSYNNIRDIRPLFDLNKLNYVNLVGNKNSFDQISKLNKKLPNCKIYER